MLGNCLYLGAFQPECFEETKLFVGSGKPVGVEKCAKACADDVKLEKILDDEVWGYARLVRRTYFSNSPSVCLCVFVVSKECS